MTDEKTYRYYSERVEEVFTRYESVVSPLSKSFGLAFPEGCTVLDIGCGSGRDLKALLDQGCNAYGVDPVSEMLDKIRSEYPFLSTRVFEGHLPDNIPDIESNTQYDGVVCSAVLMHIPLGQQLETFIKLKQLLRVSGRLLISLPSERVGLDDEHRDEHGRLFIPLDPERVKLMASQVGFNLLSHTSTSDALGRGSVKWNTLIFEKSSDLSCSLDRVESVLKSDRKVATYKLALVRAFCDIAERDENAVAWFPDGYVGMPVQSLAECWLAYYWPLVSSRIVIPQSQSDHEGSSRRISFRTELAQLISACGEGKPEEELAWLMVGWKKNTLPKQVASALQRALSAIKAAIIQGPVKHAAQGEMFWYDKKTRMVILDVELWREFCLSGHWIRDSVILRWAALCEQFSSKSDPNLNSGVILPYLLSDALPDREQNIARRMYEEKEDLKCVWSDKHISLSKMDVDHALPFSLWRNNDLWNLLPASRSVNNDKSDKIPTPELLRKRKDAIIDIWEFACDREDKVFRFEVERTLGRFREKSWQQELFEYFSERAAVAIYRRGETAWDYL